MNAWVTVWVGLAVACLVSIGWPTLVRAQEDAGRGLLALRELDRRVAGVMHRLSVANVGLCPVRQALAGWVLHADDLYSQEALPEARRLFRLQSGLPSVLALASSGPAALAGVREDDVVVSVGGRSLAALAEGAEPAAERSHRPTYENLGRQIHAIDTALATAQVDVVVQRGSDAMLYVMTPEEGCGYAAEVLPSPALNGGADGRRISITSALVSYADEENDLAFLLAHELAHNVLRHAERPRARGLGALFGQNGRGFAEVRRAEAEADRVGMFLAARAGYDVSGAASFRRRFGRDHAAARYGFFGYPSAEARARAHEETAREILQLMRQGAPLLP